jgi:hypothetical protein
MRPKLLEKLVEPHKRPSPVLLDVRCFVYERTRAERSVFL